MNVHTQRFTAIASVANSRRGRVRRLRRSCRPSDDDDDDDDATLLPRPALVLVLVL